MKRVVLPLCLLLVSILSRGSEAAVSCNAVVANLYPCAVYVAQGGTIPGSCCTGIRMLNGQAKSASDRQGVCRCIKSALGGVSYSSKNLKNAATLPAKCGVKLPYKIDPSTNCNSIK
ncbi:PREDICTED: non-specific lipid-transfer protein 10 [Camelina sativa]|uniref:Non-specific lipid-transfer protein n=1 Tax=Camelina sativa TaxID=90675 RepID=A0ABM0V709_CAMSA|nr:PREDICTED: non-specific lipid-transfer protein 10 [Camelina sativa]